MESLFESAAAHLETIITKTPKAINESDLLYLYARYKQATVGACNIPKPSFFEVAARKKWSIWNNLQSMSKNQAMIEYVDKIQSIDSSWTPEASTVRSGMGVSVSVMQKDEEDILKDEEKDIFDWCKEGSLSQVIPLLSNGFPNDEESRTLLHWACDRGHLNISEYLINQGHDVNCKDIDCLTPLHYASSCGHYDIAALLLKNGADTTIQDVDGETVIDCAASQQIKSLIEKTTSNL